MPLKGWCCCYCYCCCCFRWMDGKLRGRKFNAFCCHFYKQSLQTVDKHLSTIFFIQIITYSLWLYIPIIHKIQWKNMNNYGYNWNIYSAILPIQQKTNYNLSFTSQNSTEFNSLKFCSLNQYNNNINSNIFNSNNNIRKIAVFILFWVHKHMFIVVYFMKGFLYN